MRTLTAHDLLRFWETGLNQHPLDRALTFLSAMFPDVPYDDLASLSIGQRDTYLLTLYERTFGSQLHSQAICPSCGEKLEIMLDVAHIRAAQLSESVPMELSEGGYTIRFRLPDSFDLASIVSYVEVDSARAALLQRCIVQAQDDGKTVAVDALPDKLITTLMRHMSQADPQAEVELDFQCPECGHRWQTLFDIVAFLWEQTNVRARRLLREVHTLARAYGWHETDILAMSAARRQMYIEMVS